MKFEYSQEKSKSNLEKHGISFDEACGLWFTPSVELEARTVDEHRFMIVGKLKDRFYSCIFTIRGKAIRLISARRSHPKEEKIYHERIHQKEN